jgi:AcrR family transcriptional regulator
MNRPRRTRLPAAERRETILRAATEVFAVAGYRAAKVSDVAERVGVTEPVIFQNFGSKAALFAAVLDRAAADIRAALDGMTGGVTASALLAHILAPPEHESPSHEPPGHEPPGHGAHGREPSGPRRSHLGSDYGVLFADTAALAAEPDLAGLSHAAIRTVAAHLADLIGRAQQAGDVSPEADPQAAAWLLLSVLAARRLRSAAMPAGLEPSVGALALRALAPPERDDR